MSRKIQLTNLFNPESESYISPGYPQKRELAEAMLTYMNTPYMQDISLEIFSKDMYLSQVYLSKIFKKYYDFPPSKCLRPNSKKQKR